MPYKLSTDKLSVLDEDGKVIKKHPNPKKAKAHLIALNMNVADVKTGGKSAKQKKEALRRYLEAGARHSKGDSAMVQTIHDHAVELGAMCATKESRQYEATSFDKLREKLREELNDLFPAVNGMGSMCWIAELFDEYLIVELNYDEYWQVPYTLSGEEVEIVSRDKWQQVERQQNWVKASEARRLAHA